MVVYEGLSCTAKYVTGNIDLMPAQVLSCTAELSIAMLASKVSI